MPSKRTRFDHNHGQRPAKDGRPRAGIPSRAKKLEGTGPVPDVGESSWEEVQRLARWLDCGPHVFFHYRLAPSIITRSEGQLFGISMPRFAQRVYLGEGRHGFLNLRRIPVFCSTAKLWGKYRERQAADAPEQEEDVLLQGQQANRRRVSPSWLERLLPPSYYLQKNPCVADCVLVPTAEQAQRFKIITKDFGPLYGEPGTFIGTPYVRHIQLAGGGLCAQAACFMANMVLHDYAKGIFGVAEISALARPGLNQGHFPITGMTPQEVVSYFRDQKVGLNASIQFSQDGDEKAFGLALRGYLRSAMPVILPLDAARMDGKTRAGHGLLAESIYQSNGVSCCVYRSNPDPVRGNGHAVVAVGVGGTQSDFLVNDPLSYPFLKATRSQLWQAACYATVRSADGESVVLASGSIIPVTPSAVQLPLLGTVREDVSLSLICQMLSSKGRFFASEDTRVLEPGDGDRVLLAGLLEMLVLRFCTLTCEEIQLVEWGRWEALDLGHGPQTEDLRGQLTRALDGLAPAASWVWVVKVKGAYQVWDATLAPPPFRDVARDAAIVDRYVLATLKYDASKQTYVPVPPVSGRTGAPTISASDDGLGRSRPGDSSPAKTIRIRPSLISSITPEGIEAAMGIWPDVRGKPVACELYAFMSQDVRRLRLESRLVVPRKTWLLAVLSEKAANACDRWRKWRVRCRTKHPVDGCGHALCHLLSTGDHPAKPLAVCHMARLANSERRIAGVAAAVNTLLCNRPGSDGRPRQSVKCVAIASFLPEVASKIVSGHDPKDALCFLVKLAFALREWGHRVKVIEVVAGSLVDGVDRAWTGDPRQPVEFRATRIRQEKVFEIVCDRLKPVYAELAKPPDRNLRIAVELEPGPLVAVADLPGLHAFCDAIESRGFSDRIGINLDVAHWHLAGIRPEDIERDERLLKQIFHAHISDARNTHGDLPLGSGTIPRDVFLRWLRVLEKASKVGWYSGYVSLELEACADSAMVLESVRTLDGILKSGRW